MNYIDSLMMARNPDWSSGFEDAIEAANVAGRPWCSVPRCDTDWDINASTVSLYGEVIQ